MSKTVSVLTIIFVTATVSESQQILNLLNTNFNKLFGIKGENDAQNNRNLDEVSGRDQGNRQLKSNPAALPDVNDPPHGLENRIQQDLQYNRNEPQSSLLQSQYSEIARKRHPNPSKTDDSLRADGIPRLYHEPDPMETGIKHVYIEDKPASALDTRVKRDLRNPKDFKKKRERKKKAQKRRRKRKKERMKKHLKRQQRQQANKLKRIEKMKTMKVVRQNRTRIAEKVAKELADPHYEEVYEMSVEEKTRRPDSDEEYKHYLDPIPATDEMSSDDWRHVKYSIREKNSSECEPAWFDNIDIDNMTDSELNRRFPTEEEYDESEEDYSSSVSKKIKKIQDKQIEMVKQGKEIDSQNEESYSDDEEGSGSAEYEEEGSGSYDDEDYDSDDYDKSEDNKQKNKNEQNKGKAEQNKNTKGVKNKDKCKDGTCDHEEHNKIKENQTVRNNIKGKMRENQETTNKFKSIDNSKSRNKQLAGKTNAEEMVTHAKNENNVNVKHKNLKETNKKGNIKLKANVKPLYKEFKHDIEVNKESQIHLKNKHNKESKSKNKKTEIQLEFVGLEKPPKSSHETGVVLGIHDSPKDHHFARM